MEDVREPYAWRLLYRKDEENTGVIKVHVVENVRKECGLHTEP
jgi:hypothetical protein